MKFKAHNCKVIDTRGIGATSKGGIKQTAVKRKRFGFRHRSFVK